MAAYEVFAKHFVSGTTTAEIGCGFGYGVASLAPLARLYAACDINTKHLATCVEQHGASCPSFVAASAESLPFRDNSVDTLLSFQVIEHIAPGHPVETFLAEAKRVLIPGGHLLVSTCNRRLRLRRYQRPWNPEHKTEYSDNTLRHTLESVFQDVSLMGLVATPRVTALEKRRLRREPLWLRCTVGAYHVICHALPSTWRQRVQANVQHTAARMSNTSVAGNDNCFKVSATDFRVSNNENRDCIDILAVCTKKAAESDPAAGLVWCRG